jgi:hypothetical protein
MKLLPKDRFGTILDEQKYTKWANEVLDEMQLREAFSPDFILYNLSINISAYEKIINEVKVKYGLKFDTIKLLDLSFLETLDDVALMNNYDNLTLNLSIYMPVVCTEAAENFKLFLRNFENIRRNALRFKPMESYLAFNKKEFKSWYLELANGLAVTLKNQNDGENCHLVVEQQKGFMIGNRKERTDLTNESIFTMKVESSHTELMILRIVNNNFKIVDLMKEEAMDYYGIGCDCRKPTDKQVQLRTQVSEENQNQQNKENDKSEEFILIRGGIDEVDEDIKKIRADKSKNQVPGHQESAHSNSMLSRDKTERERCKEQENWADLENLLARPASIKILQPEVTLNKLAIPWFEKINEQLQELNTLLNLNMCTLYCLLPILLPQENYCKEMTDDEAMTLVKKLVNKLRTERRIYYNLIDGKTYNMVNLDALMGLMATYDITPNLIFVESNRLLHVERGNISVSWVIMDKHIEAYTGSNVFNLPIQHSDLQKYKQKYYSDEGTKVKIIQMLQLKETLEDKINNNG